MAGTTVLHQSYHDSTNASTLPSSPFPFSSFLSDSLFSLDPAVSAPPPPLVAPPPPQPQPTQQHQAGLFVHSKEINPFERSFAVLDSTSISDLKPALDRKNRRENGTGLKELHLPTPKGRRKRALSSPALFTPGGTGQRIDDGTAQAFRQAKRPSLRLAVEDPGGGLPAIPGLARGLVDSSASVTLSDSTGSSRSNTSISFEDDLNFVPKGSRGRLPTASPASSTGFSPPATKPSQLRASSIDSFSTSTVPPPAPTNFAHFQPQPQPIPFHIPSIAPHPVSVSGFPVSSQPFISSNFASTTLAPASMPHPAVAPLVHDPSFHESTMSYTSMEDSPYGFSDPFALVPHHAQSSIYPNLASAVPPTHPSIPPPHSAYQRASVISQAPTFSVPTHFAQLNPNSQPFVPLQASTSSTQQPPSYTTQTSSKSVDFGAKPTGKKRGRKPKNWDPTLEMEIELDPEEQEKQRKLALERNRIAASKSRRRKKEKVEALEGAARGYCEGNQTLQSQCQALLAEVHQLRAYLIQAHPQPGCQCHHVHGYLARERDGGGLNAIMFEAQGTLERDYSKAPKWGNEDDVYAGIDCDQHRRQNKSAKASTSVETQRSQSTGGGGAKPKPKSPVKKGGKKQPEPESEDDDDIDDGEDESEEESEEEKVALKSRRARAIPLRKT